MFCRNCGQPLEESAKFCSQCGTDVAGTAPVIEDKANLGFAILGFLIPLVGLILYLIYDGKNQPKKAKSAGKGALVGVITGVAFTALMFVFYFLFLFTMLIGSMW